MPYKQRRGEGSRRSPTKYQWSEESFYIGSKLQRPNAVAGKHDGDK